MSANHGFLTVGNLAGATVHSQWPVSLDCVEKAAHQYRESWIVAITIRRTN
jgi:ethanolamine transporter EutH